MDAFLRFLNVNITVFGMETPVWMLIVFYILVIAFFILSRRIGR